MPPPHCPTWHPHCPTWHECCHARVRVLARLDRRAAQSVPPSKRASARRALLEARGPRPSHSDCPPHHPPSPGVWHSAVAGAATEGP